MPHIVLERSLVLAVVLWKSTQEVVARAVEQVLVEGILGHSLEVLARIIGTLEVLAREIGTLERTPERTLALVESLKAGTLVVLLEGITWEIWALAMETISRKHGTRIESLESVAWIIAKMPLESMAWKVSKISLISIGWIITKVVISLKSMAWKVAKIISRETLAWKVAKVISLKSLARVILNREIISLEVLSLETNDWWARSHSDSSVWSLIQEGFKHLGIPFVSTVAALEVHNVDWLEYHW